MFKLSKFRRGFCTMLALLCVLMVSINALEPVQAQALETKVIYEAPEKETTETKPKDPLNPPTGDQTDLRLPILGVTVIPLILLIMYLAYRRDQQLAHWEDERDEG